MFKVSGFSRFFILNSQLSSEKELACIKMNHSSVSKLRGDMSVVGDFVKELCSSRKMSKFNSQRFKYLSFQSYKDSPVAKTFNSLTAIPFPLFCGTKSLHHRLRLRKRFVR